MWRGVVRETDGDYRIYGYRTIAGLTQGAESATELVRTVDDDSATTTVARVLETNAYARQVAGFFRSPVWTANADGSATLRDLRFASLRLSGRQPFVFEFQPQTRP
jgi:hypothetical protein